MDTRLLRAFVVVAEELNFRKAADRLGMTQPPLTRLISQLEADLDTKLFVRTTRMVQLTGAGLHLFKKGTELLDQISQLEKEVRTLKPTRNGKIFISMDHGALHTALPRILSSFKEQFPNIEVCVTKVVQSQIRRQIKEAKIDLHFGANVFAETWICRTKVQSQELGLLIPKENRLSQKKQLKLSDLRGETLIFHGKHEHLGFQEDFLALLLSRDIKPRVYYKKTHESCGRLVTQNNGIMLITKKSSQHHPEAEFVPFEDYSAHLKIYGTWAQDNPSLPLKAFLNFLQNSNDIPKSELDGHLR